MLYSYQANLFLAVTIVYGNRGMFWHLLTKRPPAPTDESLAVNYGRKELVLSFLHLDTWDLL